MPTTYLTWRLAPPGSTSETTLRESIDGPQGQGRLAGFDPDRFENLILLNPNHKYEDPEGIDGYSVFTFDWTPKALMECFNRNNAMFVLGEDMEVWPKGDKQELRNHPSVTWIPHREGWREKLKEALAPSND